MHIIRLALSLCTEAHNIVDPAPVSFTHPSGRFAASKRPGAARPRASSWPWACRPSKPPQSGTGTLPGPPSRRFILDDVSKGSENEFFPTPVGTPGGKPQRLTARAKIARARLDRVLAGGATFLFVCQSHERATSQICVIIWERKSARALAFQPVFQRFESRMPFAPRREPPRAQISEK